MGTIIGLNDKWGRLVWPAPALAALAACYSTGGGGGSGSLVSYAEDVGTIHEALEDGTTLNARSSAMSSYILTDWAADERRLGGKYRFFHRRKWRRYLLDYR